ncbi:peptidase inhibitor family I36 protein [Streptomyces sp. NPDC005576]|uniref:peptidase inhibitor family I36 protein n=1 Tax=unclassified Streptomyces TaxID=2593676 RepID=UPI00340AF81B
MPVTVYADADYQGKSATLGPGRHKLDQGMNDVISSVRVPAGWSATLHEHADFTGRQVTLETDTRSVGDGLHDKASAIVITPPDKHDEHAQFDEDDEDDFIVFQA